MSSRSVRVTWPDPISEFSKLGWGGDGSVVKARAKSPEFTGSQAEVVLICCQCSYSEEGGGAQL